MGNFLAILEVIAIVVMMFSPFVLLGAVVIWSKHVEDRRVRDQISIIESRHLAKRAAVEAERQGGE